MRTAGNRVALLLAAVFASGSALLTAGAASAQQQAIAATVNGAKMARLQGDKDRIDQALGPCAVVEEQAAQRIADGDLQRASGNGRNQAGLSRRVQAHAVPHSDVWLLRMEGHAERQAALVFHCRRRLAAANGSGTLG